MFAHLYISTHVYTQKATEIYICNPVPAQAATIIYVTNKLHLTSVSQCESL